MPNRLVDGPRRRALRRFAADGPDRPGQSASCDSRPRLVDLVSPTLVAARSHGSLLPHAERPVGIRRAGGAFRRARRPSASGTVGDSRLRRVRPTRVQLSRLRRSRSPVRRSPQLGGGLAPFPPRQPPIPREHLPAAARLGASALPAAHRSGHPHPRCAELRRLRAARVHLLVNPRPGPPLRLDTSQVPGLPGIHRRRHHVAKPSRRRLRRTSPVHLLRLPLTLRSSARTR